MFSLTLPLLTALLAASPLVNDGAAELRYQGTLSGIERDGSRTPLKSFEVYALANSAGDARDATFLVTQEGEDQLQWPDRFGRFRIATRTVEGGVAEGAVIRILHSHNETPQAVEVDGPFFGPVAKLQEDADWTAGDEEYRVAGSKTVRGHDCWQVDVSHRFGRNRTYSVEKTSGLIVSATRQFFLGQGDRFEIALQLESAVVAEPAALARIRTAADELVALQETLARPEGDVRKPLTAAQIASVAASTERIVGVTAETPFAQLGAVIDRDIKAQQQRAKTVADLAARFVGRPAPPFAFTKLDGKAVDPAEHQGQVVVLHFWTYRDEPLEEPYGQVGYLDFLHGQRAKLGVKVYGVALDPEAAVPAARPALVRSVRKLKTFMNLSYELTVDGGETIKAFGDPRQFEAPLPLWVVIGADGKIAHYRTGFYDIHADKGLEELDEVVGAEIRKRPQ